MDQPHAPNWGHGALHCSVQRRTVGQDGQINRYMTLGRPKPVKRLITIEDAFEPFPGHPNTVALLADRGTGSQRSANARLQA